MSCVFVVVPVVAGSWPLISAAILAAGAAMGYSAVRNAEKNSNADLAGCGADSSGVSLVMEDSQIMAESLSRGESFTLQRDGLSAVFRMDGRGQCTVHVADPNRSKQELEAAGQELMDRVRQQFAYSKVMAEMEERGFQVIGQEVDADNSIRLRVRRVN